MQRRLVLDRLPNRTKGMQDTSAGRRAYTERMRGRAVAARGGGTQSAVLAREDDFVDDAEFHASSSVIGACDENSCFTFSGARPASVCGSVCKSCKTEQESQTDPVTLVSIFVPMRFWWVNQNQTFRQEVKGGYLWSPKLKADGARNPFYDSMREVSPGDIVFSFSDGPRRECMTTTQETPGSGL
jgi:hypothetical protein